MEVKSLETLVSILREQENPEEYIKAYGDQRQALGFSHGWEQCAVMHRNLKARNKTKLRNHILDFDEENGCLPLVEFIKFFSALEDELKATMKYDDAASAYAESLHDFIWAKLGDIKTDRRMLFAKE